MNPFAVWLKRPRSDGARAALAAFLLLLAPAALLLAYVWAFPGRADPFDLQLARGVRARIEGTAPVSVETPSTLIIADSTGSMGINASLIDGAYSLSLVNGSIVEGFYALERWLAHRPKPRCLISVWSQNWPNYKAFFWRTFVRAGFYDSRELAEIRELSAAQGSFPGATYPAPFFQLESLLYRSKLAGWSLAELQESLLHPSSFVEKRAQRLASLDRNSGSYLLWNFRPPAPSLPPVMPEGATRPLFDLYARKFVELAAREGIRHFLVTIPDPVGSPFDRTEETEKARKMMREQVLAHEGNRAIDPDIVLTQEDFSYPLHLTAAGANRFTNALLEQFRCD